MSKPYRRYYKRKFVPKQLSIAKKALRKVNKLARRVKPEQKIHDIVNTTLSPPAAGIVTDLSAIGQGDTVITRDGLELRAFFFEFRWHILKHATPTHTDFRILIVRDNRQVESTAPSMLNVLLAATPNSQYSRVNPKRFTVLYNLFASVRTNKITMERTVTRKISFPIRYIGAGTGDITKNGIFLITQSNAAAGQEPNFQFTWRLRFTDV